MANKRWQSPELTAATGILTFSTNPSDGDTATIGGSGTNSKVFTFQATLTDVDGNVHIGTDQDESLTNLVNAINDTGGGTAGTDYALGTLPHFFVTAVADTGADTCTITATILGTVANAFVTTKVSTALSWGGATMSGAVGGSWATASNWGPVASVPVDADDVKFSSDSLASVTGGFDQSLIQLDSMFTSKDYVGGSIGSRRDLLSFTATSATATTVVDTTAKWQTDIFTGYEITQTTGTGIKQKRTITSNTIDTITVPAWDVTPDVADVFIIQQFNDLNIDITLFTHQGNCPECLITAATAGAGAIDEAVIGNVGADNLFILGGFVDLVTHTDGEIIIDYNSTVPVISVVKVSGNPLCVIQPDCTLTDVNSFGGAVESFSSITTGVLTTGTMRISDFTVAPTVTTLKVIGTGILTYNSRGTLTTLDVTGVADFSNNLGPVTITNAQLFEKGEIKKNNGLDNITFTNGVKVLSPDEVVRIRVDPGTTITFA